MITKKIYSDQLQLQGLSIKFKLKNTLLKIQELPICAETCYQSDNTHILDGYTYTETIYFFFIILSCFVVLNFTDGPWLSP